jgi:hypothetical protein
MFVGGVVLVIDGILVLFLMYKFYGAGVFVPTGGNSSNISNKNLVILLDFWRCFGICLFVDLYLFEQIELPCVCLFVRQIRI